MSIELPSPDPDPIIFLSQKPVALSSLTVDGKIFTFKDAGFEIIDGISYRKWILPIADPNADITDDTPQNSTGRHEVQGS